MSDKRTVFGWEQEFFEPDNRRVLLAKQRYSYEKRQREIEKKKKKEEKQQKKTEKKKDSSDTEISETDAQ